MSPENFGTIRPFPCEPLPERFCNYDRLLEMLELWNLDGLVLSSEKNVFYLSGFNPIAHKGDEPRPYALILSRFEPEHPILLVADYYLGHFASQPSWVEDIRPVRAVMLPKDLPASENDLDRFIPETIQNPFVWGVSVKRECNTILPRQCQKQRNQGSFSHRHCRCRHRPAAVI